MDPFFAIAIFLLGLAFGSFLNVCIHRMPRRILLSGELADAEAELAKLQASQEGPPAELPADSPAVRDLRLGALRARIAELQEQIANLSIVAPASACPACKTPIRPYDNIPVVSWLLLRGRCRQCRAPISPRYLVVELVTALLFLACYAKFGLALSTLKYCILSFLLLGLIFSDAEHKLLPDDLTLTGLAAGIVFSLIVPVSDLLSVLLPGMVALPRNSGVSWRLLSFGDATLGALVGASFIYGAGVLYLRARGIEGMGLGDVKLMAMVGSFLGVRLTVLTLFGASLAGTIVGVSTILAVWMKRTRRRMARNRETAAQARKRAWRSAKTVYRYYQMPFGVFLGGMAMAALFFGDWLLRWYWSLYW